MTTKRKRLISALLVLLVTSCSHGKGHEPREHVDAEEHTRDHHEHGHDPPHHDERGHDDEDLEMSMTERFELSCEHGVKAFECDECRYEVGVVKAPERLFEGGLITQAEAARRAVTIPLRLTGEIRFDDRRVAHVSTQAEGLIRRVHVTLGDSVKKGDPLITLASVAVGEAQAALKEADAELRLAAQNAERMAALHKERIAADKELLQATQALEAARIRAEAAREKLKRLGTRGKTGAASGKLVLRAPTDGTVLDMHAVAGELARSDTPLVTVGNNTSLWVWADLYERDLAAVLTAQAESPLLAEISVKAFPKERFDGTVDFISPAMNELSRTVRVRIAVPNPEKKLLAGMFADVTLSIPNAAEVLAVPSGAVMEDEGKQFVFVHHDGPYYARVKVITGRAFEGWTEITAGLALNQFVISDGAFLMKSDVLRAKMGAGCAD